MCFTGIDTGFLLKLEGNLPRCHLGNGKGKYITMVQKLAICFEERNGLT